MVEQKKYSIISISEDDDDVVIQAGDTSHSADKAAFAATPAPEEEAVQSEEEAAEPEEADSPRADRQRASREAELERLRQAEEDLNAKAPFPAMRAVIFAVAIVLIALAFVWLAFFR